MESASASASAAASVGSGPLSALQSIVPAVPPPAYAFAYSLAAFIRDQPVRAGMKAAAEPDPPEQFPRRCNLTVAVRVRPLNARENDAQLGRPLTTTIHEDGKRISILQQPEGSTDKPEAAAQSTEDRVDGAADAAALFPPLVLCPRGAGWQPPARASSHQGANSPAVASSSAAASAAPSGSVDSTDCASAASGPSAACPASAEPAPWDRTPPAPRSFSFDRTYGSDATNAQLYGDLIRPLLSGVMDGFGATVLAYGASGAGKTFAIKGPSSSTRPVFEGLLPMVLRDIFAAIDQQQSCVPGPSSSSSPASSSAAAASASASSSLCSLDFSSCVVRMSCLELHQERLLDCLLPLGSDEQQEPRISEVAGALLVQPLTWTVAPSLHAAMRLLDLAQRRIQLRHTHMGTLQSRASKFYRIRIEKRVSAESAAVAAGALSPSSSPDRLQVGHLTFVDVCCSNCPAKSIILTQAARINSALSSLRNVVHALSQPPPVAHVPYRDSKLTRLLQPALGGNDRTVLLALLSPSALEFEESLATFRFAARAAAVETKPRRRFDPDPDPAASLRQWDADFADRRRQLIARGRCLLQRSLIWRLPLPRVLIDHVATFVTLGAGQRPDQQIRDPRLQARTNNGAVQEAESAAASALASLPSK